MASSFVTKKRETLPLVPLRDMVVFPHMMAPFIVGRESSVRALERALSGSTKRIFLAAQKDPRIDDPLRDDICDVGVDRHRDPEPQAAQRQRAGDGRGGRSAARSSASTRPTAP